MEQIIQCPTCQKDIPVEVEMYIDSGDVCYDVAPDEESVEETTESMTYQCKNCQHTLELEPDPNHWGSQDIPILVKIPQNQ